MRETWDILRTILEEAGLEHKPTSEYILNELMVFYRFHGVRYPICRIIISEEDWLRLGLWGYRNLNRNNAQGPELIIHLTNPGSLEEVVKFCNDQIQIGKATGQILS